MPFIAYNIPDVDAVAKKWADIDYLSNKLGGKEYRAETAKTNHFMYWKQASPGFLRTAEGAKWEHPTKVISDTFEHWLEIAVCILLLHF